MQAFRCSHCLIKIQEIDPNKKSWSLIQRGVQIQVQTQTNCNISQYINKIKEDFEVKMKKAARLICRTYWNMICKQIWTCNMLWLWIPNNVYVVWYKNKGCNGYNISARRGTSKRQLNQNKKDNNIKVERRIRIEEHVSLVFK